MASFGDDCSRLLPFGEGSLSGIREAATLFHGRACGPSLDHCQQEISHLAVLDCLLPGKYGGERVADVGIITVSLLGSRGCMGHGAWGIRACRWQLLLLIIYHIQLYSKRPETYGHSHSDLRSALLRKTQRCQAHHRNPA